MLVLVFTRENDRWAFTKLHEGSLELPEIGLALTLADIYEGVTPEV